MPTAHDEAGIHLGPCTPPAGGGRRIDNLPMSTRLRTILRHYRIDTLEQLANCTGRELSIMPNFGEKCLTEVKELLATRGLELKADLGGTS